MNDCGSEQIKFCIRTDVNEDIERDIVSIKFVEAFITVNINLEGNFEIQSIALGESGDANTWVIRYQKRYACSLLQDVVSTELNNCPIMEMICVLVSMTKDGCFCARAWVLLSISLPHMVSVVEGSLLAYAGEICLEDQKATPQECENSLEILTLCTVVNTNESSISTK